MLSNDEFDDLLSPDPEPRVNRRRMCVSGETESNAPGTSSWRPSPSSESSPTIVPPLAPPPPPPPPPPGPPPRIVADQEYQETTLVDTSYSGTRASQSAAKTVTVLPAPLPTAEIDLSSHPTNSSEDPVTRPTIKSRGKTWRFSSVEKQASVLAEIGIGILSRDDRSRDDIKAMDISQLRKYALEVERLVGDTLFFHEDVEILEG